MWQTLESFVASGYQGNVAIRTKGVGTRCDYHIPAQKLPSRYAEFVRQGWKPEQLNISAMMPDDKIVLQGEACRNLRGMDVVYSTEQLPMRSALAKSRRYASGIVASELLRTVMDPSSFDWLIELLDTYHLDSAMSSVVEFSVYSICLGDIDNRNTLFWEVRNY